MGVTLDWVADSLGPLIGDLVISRILLCLCGAPGYIVLLLSVVLFGMHCDLNYTHGEATPPRDQVQAPVCILAEY